MDFEALVNEHKDAVYRQMMRVCGNREDAEDVLIEALLRAYLDIDRLQQAAAFRAWLAQIGRRVCWNLRRRDALLPLLQLSALGEQGMEARDPTPGPEAQLVGSQLRTMLHEALGVLTPECRSVYELRELRGLSGEQTAATLGITLAAMKSRLARARTAIRSALDVSLAQNLGSSEK